MVAFCMPYSGPSRKMGGGEDCAPPLAAALDTVRHYLVIKTTGRLLFKNTFKK